MNSVSRSCWAQLIVTIKVDVTLLDLAIAFGKGPAAMLLYTRAYYVVRGMVNNRSMAFLGERKQHVVLAGTHSDQAVVAVASSA